MLTLIVIVIIALAIYGFITNMAITSQTAITAAVGPILVSLMLAAGLITSTYPTPV